jgi:hypothetical protein
MVLERDSHVSVVFYNDPVIEKWREHNIPTYVGFIDSEKHLTQ